MFKDLTIVGTVMMVLCAAPIAMSEYVHGVVTVEGVAVSQQTRIDSTARVCLQILTARQATIGISPATWEKYAQEAYTCALAMERNRRFP